jgi:hypothetical protein
MVGKKKALREGVSKSPEGIAIGKGHLHGVQFRRSHVAFGSGQSIRAPRGGRLVSFLVMCGALSYLESVPITTNAGIRSTCNR